MCAFLPVSAHRSPSNLAPDIPQAYKTLQATYRAGTTRPLSWRKHQLNQIVLLFRENLEALIQAFAIDLRKPRLEIIAGETAPLSGAPSRAPRCSTDGPGT